MIAEHRGKIAAIDQSLAQRRAERESTAKLVEKGERTLPLITARSFGRELAEEKLVTRNGQLELEQERIEAEQDLAARRANLQSTSAAINELSERRAAHGDSGG